MFDCTSIGYGLWANANDNIYFPTYQRNITLEELLEQHIPKLITIEKSSDSGWCDRMISVGKFAKKIRSLALDKLFSRQGGKSEGRRQLHWWTSFIEGIFDIVW